MGEVAPPLLSEPNIETGLVNVEKREPTDVRNDAVDAVDADAEDGTSCDAAATIDVSRWIGRKGRTASRRSPGDAGTAAAAPAAPA